MFGACFVLGSSFYARNEMQIRYYLVLLCIALSKVAEGSLVSKHGFDGAIDMLCVDLREVLFHAER